MLPVPEPPKEQFPDAVRVGDLRFPLQYRFDPGHPADGVTATVPLGVLNQLDADPFEWLVPGWLEEKVAALIKALPKELRVQFVPVPTRPAPCCRTSPSATARSPPSSPGTSAG